MNHPPVHAGLAALGVDFPSRTPSNRLGIALCGALVSLTFGLICCAPFMFDDYLHRLFLFAQPAWAAGGGAEAQRFLPPQAAEAAQLISLAKERAIFPWYTSAAFRAAPFRPLEKLSFVVDHALSRLLPPVAHIHSALWYFAAVGAVFFFSRRYLAATRSALLVTALFAIHPSHAFAAQWVSNRSAAITATLGIWGLFLLHKYRRLTLSAFILFCAALFTSEYGVIVGCAFLGLLYTQQEITLRKRLYSLLPVALAIVVYLALYRVFGFGMVDSGIYWSFTGFPSLTDTARFFVQSTAEALVFNIIPFAPSAGFSVGYGLLLLFAVLLHLVPLFTTTYRREAILILCSTAPSVLAYSNGRTLWLSGLWWLILAAKFLKTSHGNWATFVVKKALSLGVMLAIVVWFGTAFFINEVVKLEDVLRDKIASATARNKYSWLLGSPLDGFDLAIYPTTLGFKQDPGTHMFWLMVSPASALIQRTAPQSMEICVTEGLWPGRSVFRARAVAVDDSWRVNDHLITAKRVLASGVAECISVETQAHLLDDGELVFWNGLTYENVPVPPPGSEIAFTYTPWIQRFTRK